MAQVHLSALSKGIRQLAFLHVCFAEERSLNNRNLVLEYNTKKEPKKQRPPLFSRSISYADQD
jgi:hypothetical protein